MNQIQIVLVFAATGSAAFLTLHYNCGIGSMCPTSTPCRNKYKPTEASRRTLTEVHLKAARILSSTNYLRNQIMSYHIMSYHIMLKHVVLQHNLLSYLLGWWCLEPPYQFALPYPESHKL